ncbi:MAG: M48 family metallopeptidase [bacterium]
MENHGAVYLAIVLAVLAGDYLLEVAVEKLNLSRISTMLPEEFKGFYDPGRYEKSQEYIKDNTKFGLVTGTVLLVLTLAFILLGGFNLFDRFARSFGLGNLLTGLVFAFSLKFLSDIASIPFSAWHTFVIEEKYGFNRTTIRTFAADTLKSWFLALLIGGPVFMLVVWFFERTGPSAWLGCWLAVSAAQLLLIFAAPVLIMPFFNKFEPLTDGELRKTIESYASAQNFRMRGVYTMDGSRRSTKSNAFFTGFGKFRRIVLFDTLIARHGVDELVAILAHEMGHYKKRHVLKSIVISALSTGLMFYVLSLFIKNQGLSTAFGMENLSVYSSLILFAFLYSPVSTALGIAGNWLSRRHEYQADLYAVSTFGKPQALAVALKKLSVDNLSNLTPHPLKVFLEYSHPPVLERIKALESFRKGLQSIRVA